MAACALSGAFAALALFFAWDAGLFLPRWTEWSECSISADLGGGNAKELVELSRRRVSVEGDIAFETPVGWKVFSVATADLDGNGTNELLMALWKRGADGTSRAIWEDGWHPHFAQHLYVYTVKDRKVVPFWMGGDLDARITSMFVDDDSHVHLMALRGEDTVWEWGTWGFSRIDTE